MFEKLSDNLNFLMAKARINASELARKTDLPASTINKIRNRDNSNPTLLTLIPLANYFSMTVSQLVGDESLSGISLCARRLPLITWEEAVSWPNIDKENFSLLDIQNKYGENAYALKVEEEGWEGFARDSFLIIDPIVPAEHRDFVIVHKIGQKNSSLKQILYDEGQSYLKPVMTGYKLTECTDQHKILGVVMEYRKQLKIML